MNKESNKWIDGFNKYVFRFYHDLNTSVCFGSKKEADTETKGYRSPKE